MAKKNDAESLPVEAQAEASPTSPVSELAKKHGQTQPAPVAGDAQHSADHLVASALNGWAWHAYYRGGEALLSDENYLGAIDAAKQGKAYAPANLRPAETAKGVGK